MQKHVIKVSKHTILVTLEIVAVCVVLCLLGLGGLLWRLHTGPLDMEFAREHIEKALYDKTSNTQVVFDKAVILWPEFKEPIQLHLEHVTLRRDTQDLLSIDTLDLGLLSAPLFAGKVRIRTVVLDGPDLYISRSQENKLSLQLQDTPISPEELQKQPKEKKDFTLKFLSRFTASKQGDSLSSLQTISITNANLIVNDQRLGLTWSMPPLNLNFAKDKRGLIISADMAIPPISTQNDTKANKNKKKKAGSINAELIFLTADRSFNIDIDFKKLDPRFIAEKFQSLGITNANELLIDGHLRAVLSPAKGVEVFNVKLSSDKPVLELPELYASPITFKRASFNIDYNHQKRRIKISDTYLTLDNDHFTDMKIKLNSDISLASNIIRAPVKLRLNKVAQSKIKHLWPIPLKGEGAEVWFTNNIRDGSYENVVLDIDLTLTKHAYDWVKTFQGVEAQFDFSDTTIDYRSPLLPVSSSSGKGTYADDILEIDVNKAKLGDMDISNSHMLIENVIADNGYATVDINLNGALESVLKYIEPEPIGFKTDNINADSSELKGDATLDIQVKFPTLKDLPEDEVKVAINGTVKDMVLPDLIGNLNLTGPSYDFSYKDSLIKLSGSGHIIGQGVKSPIDIEWERYADSEDQSYESKISARTEINDAILESVDIDIKDWISGDYPATIEYTDFGTKSIAEVKGDLTTAYIFFDPFDYIKYSGEKCVGSVKILLENERVTEVQDLNINNENFKISGGRFIFEKRGEEDYLKRGQLESLKLFETDLVVDFERPQETVFKVAAQGDFLDARPFLGQKQEDTKRKDPTDREGKAQTIQASIDVKRMRTHPARMIESAKAYIDINPEGHLMQLELDATAGKGDIYLRLKPDENGIQTLQLEAQDAGATLQAFDIYEDVQDGTLFISGQAVDPENPRVITGTFSLKDFRAVRTPVLANMLTFIGPDGVMSSGKEGIPFSRLEAEFEWDMTDTSYIYKVKDGRTSGASLGLTFDGYIDKKTDKVKVTGTIIPISGLNKAISSIPLIGDLLGGGGAIIAATYKVSGPSKNPTVSVNPLAALTPGILRRILFESNPNKDKRKDDDQDYNKERSTLNE